LPEKEVQKKVDQVIEQEGWVLSSFFNTQNLLYPSFSFSTSSPRTLVFEAGKEEERDGIADDRCNITDDGKAALLRLSKGDMRRALNVLQVSSYPLSPFSLFHSVLPHIAWTPPTAQLYQQSAHSPSSSSLELTTRHATQHMTKSTKRQSTHVLVIPNLKI
jgi:hypothetical protein